MENVSLALSVLAILGSVLGYLLHDRRLKAQESMLNAYQLKKYEEEIVLEKKAEMRANIVKGERGLRIIKIYNKGKAKALNVRLLMDKDGFLIRDKAFPKAFINPGEGAEFHVHITMGAPDNMDLTILWDDESALNNEYHQILDF